GPAFWTIAVVAIIAALWLAWAGLFGDRARGRPRCPRCWHSLDGLPGNESGGRICPECGKGIACARRMLRTRRRWWRIAAAALLVASSCYAFTVYQRRAEGWRAWMPTLAAVLILPREPVWPDPSQPMAKLCHEVLAGRRDTPAFPEWQHRLLLWRHRDLSKDTIWEHVHIRDAWVRGEPIVVHFDGHSFSGRFCRERVAIEGEGLDKPIVGRSTHFDRLNLNPNYFLGSRGTYRPTSRWRLEGGTEAKITLTADVRIYQYESPFSLPPLPRGPFKQRRVTRTFMVRLVDSIDQALEASPLVQARARGHDDFLLNNYHLRLDGSRVSAPFATLLLRLQRDVCYAIEAEIRRGDVLVGRHQPRYEGNPDEWWWADDDDELAMRFPTVVPLEVDEYTVRLIPRPDLAFRELEYDRYWVPSDGSAYLEVPLRRVLRESKP
ncbi:MAG: hypothetical protein K8E66_04510, partial [Phycisphaerales bacterium]|nr:hypothetical protein [Phycisphaerales bacterium]